MELSAEEKEEYRGCKIVDIMYGKTEGRKHILYASLVNAGGEIMISATLDYIVANLPERLPN